VPRAVTLSQVERTRNARKTRLFRSNARLDFIDRATIPCNVNFYAGSLIDLLITTALDVPLIYREATSAFSLSMENFYRHLFRFILFVYSSLELVETCTCP